MSDFMIDWEREARTGIAEAIYCESKSVTQISNILDCATTRRFLLTRLSPEKMAALAETQKSRLDYDPVSRTAFWGEIMPPTQSGPGIVCAGTSDLPVAKEVQRTLCFYGYSAPLICDVGIAGLWRLMKHLEEIRSFSIVLAVAGMEGALFSVLAGLIDAPLIAVPTSVGYGVSKDGELALRSALGSCSPGILTVNIDNGFGAACSALRIFGKFAQPGRSAVSEPDSTAAGFQQACLV